MPLVSVKWLKVAYGNKNSIRCVFKFKTSFGIKVY